MLGYIDVHTHKSSQPEDTFAIQNIIANKVIQMPENQPISIGLHPWYLEKNSLMADFELLKTATKSQKNVLSIGEIGLDRLCETNFELQIEMFERQILLAEQLNKPIIAHCVRAFSDIISIKKRLRPKVPIIIHGFNQKFQVLSELIRHEFYISIGAAILDISSNAFHLIDQIPKNLIFLETDESPEHISKIYEMASMRMQITENELIEQIKMNFERVFVNAL
jgi:TatD DNase family protein